ncbi:MAG: glycosyltransferase [Desulfobacterales bacterium]|nr:MAG: glycosyltransferase [Desulfobacterales bacterium]
MMRIGLYLENKKIRDADLRFPEQGNPGIGGTQFNFVTLPYYFQKYFPNEVEFILFANEIQRLPASLRCLPVGSCSDAADKCARNDCDIFLYRPTYDNNGMDTLRVMQETDLRGIAWAHSDIPLEYLNALAKCRQIQQYVCVGQQQLNRLSTHKIFGKATCIVNGFDTANYIPGDSCKKDTHTIVFLGNLIPAKGFHWLARVWPEVIKVIPEAKLSVIGNGALYDRNSKLGKWGVAQEDYETDHIRPYLSDANGKLHPSVKFMGLLGVSKIPLLQKAAMGIVNPSTRTENCPGCAIELQASGTAVVSTAANGLLDTVIHKKTGLLGRNLTDLAANIIYLLQNKAESRRLGKHGIDFVRTSFSYEKVCWQWLYLFRQLCAPQKVNHFPSAEIHSQKQPRTITSLLEQIYTQKCKTPSDINTHLPILRKYAEQCNHITEFGVRGVVSTWALLAAKPQTLNSYDVKYHPNIEKAKEIAAQNNIDFTFKTKNVLHLEIKGTDLLFIDTYHTYDQLKKELCLHGNKARKYLIMHDTTIFGRRGADGMNKGLLDAIEEFISENHHWQIIEQTNDNIGLTIMQRLNP